jgi:hypothetical protein
MIKEIKKGCSFFINGKNGTHKMTLVFEKEAAREFATGLLGAIDSSIDTANSIGMELYVHIKPNSRVLVVEGGLSKESEKVIQ